MNGTVGSAGAKGLTWRGAWDGLVTYQPDDAVEHNGSAFIALSMSTGAAPPNSQWQLLAAAGAQGAPGQAGSQGTQGPKGDKGDTGASGADGASVAVIALQPAHSVCPHGGTLFQSKSGDAYACHGAPGLAGVSVSAIALSPGVDSNCPAGGTKFVTGASQTYACNATLAGPCPAGQTLCGSSCVNLQSDASNCGLCARACDSRTCVNGLCAKLAFTTSQTFTGNLGGVTGADSKCQAAATAVSLGGTYRAWISDSLGHSPGATFVRSQAPYVTVNGAMVAANWSALLSSTTVPLVNGIGLDEHGAWPAENPWTGTKPSGVPANLISQNCSDWTSNTGFGYAGDWGSVGGTWTEHAGVSCGLPRSLYCFEQ